MMTQHGLYDPLDEHDACGVGFIAAIDGSRQRAVVEKGIAALKNVFHRGAVHADGKTGDGAGIMLQIPRAFFAGELERMGKRLAVDRALAVGMLFLPRTEFDAQESCRVIIENEVMQAGYELLGWRQVPVNPDVIGEGANATRPEITQLLLECPADRDGDRIEADLYLLRKRIEREVGQRSIKNFYACSLSHRKIIYKGLFLAEQLDAFYPDLQDDRFTSAFAIFHQRFSTNTAPNWPLAQPFRLIAHNGEINTVRGNTNWMQTHEASMSSPVFGEDIKLLSPVIPDGGSDTAALDAVTELLVRAGRPLPMAKLILVPPSWSKNPSIPDHHKALFNYCNCVMSPWDGPAAIVAQDGDWLLAGMDRNGLRPMRYQITADGFIAAGSETGMVPLDRAAIRETGRLGPGELLGLNLAEGKWYRDSEIKDAMAARHPFAEWVGQITQLRDLPSPSSYSDTPSLRAERSNLTQSAHSSEIASLSLAMTEDELTRRQRASGWTREDLDQLLAPMVTDAKEGIGSMGDDTPLAVLSEHYRGLHHFFRQRFSQVTNPPIDSLREAQVMSLRTRIGNKENILSEEAVQTRLIELDDPIVMEADFARLSTRLGDEVATLDATFDRSAPNGLRAGVDRLVSQLTDLYMTGKRHFVITDEETSVTRVALPMVLAVAALHTHTVQRGIRKQISLMVRCGEVLDVHHFAVLIGVGATVVTPYLVEATIRERHGRNLYPSVSLADALANYKKAVGNGLLKIMSKMGISVISSYRGGSIFEAIGLSRSLIATYFPTLTSRISGIGLRGIEERVVARHRLAWDNERVLPLPIGGYYAYRAGGEAHAWEGRAIHLLQEATATGRSALYKRYSAMIRDGRPLNLRDLLAFASRRQPIALDEVESVNAIRRRFIAPAMSLGALSKEAHETLAIAMNRIGAFSNSGEGGEGPERYTRRENGDNANSRIKQVASGRFGVTAAYLNSADELQIKVAQGAKPGEGGQLPGFKVTVDIARQRHATPGVTLISPPPHHDIYSIEDIAQLIYDLKQINPRAVVSVKLVSQSGVGTIASGLAKAHVDKIVISGHSGGTGASPYSSIKHAGTPWEMGLSEANQVLTMNRLRHRVTLQTDGGLKTGRDIVMAALLGAEEYGLGTLSLVAIGCLLVRQCHSNTCPVGICTQDEALRAKYDGSVDKVINLVTFLAEEVREILAELGYRSLDEIIGRTDLLHQVHSGSADLDTLDLGPLLIRAEAAPLDGTPYPRIATVRRNPVADTLDESLLPEIERAIVAGENLQLDTPVRNIHRSVGTRISSLLTRSEAELADGQIHLRLRGSAGQSLGAFGAHGLKIEVLGDANDYVGKGLSGATITLRPRSSALFTAREQTIIGNTCLYGATSGRLFAAGQAGERFAVRNSGATAVIEGAGTNACEYMTGGVVVILGEIGTNFGAGMTGGMAFLYNPDTRLDQKLNDDSVFACAVGHPHWQEMLRLLIVEHAERTASVHARALLEDWPATLNHFRQIVPREIANKLDHPLTVDGDMVEAFG